VAGQQVIKEPVLKNTHKLLHDSTVLGYETASLGKWFQANNLSSSEPLKMNVNQSFKTTGTPAQGCNVMCQKNSILSHATVKISKLTWY
jgi:hypothetical protein